MNEWKKYTVQFATNDRADFSLWLNLASDLFENFTWQPVNGVYRGDAEVSYKLEILSETDILASVKYLARYIKNAYHQDCVLVSVEKINVEFV